MHCLGHFHYYVSLPQASRDATSETSVTATEVFPAFTTLSMLERKADIAYPTLTQLARSYLLTESTVVKDCSPDTSSKDSDVEEVENLSKSTELIH